ncbi:MAG: acyl-CoA dehydratase activase [Actinobacteria bacterium]|nr:acyl-CoA dehydratase activase [Actinomycetota bacterium]
MPITAGVDVGSSSVKAVIVSDDGTGPIIVAKEFQRIRKRDPQEVTRTTFDLALSHAGVAQDDLAYVASTGEGTLVDFKTGHFYGMTTHAMGGKYLYPDTATVVDIGALQQRAISVAPNGGVRRYKMTGQCASGSGQFVENIVRYLGVRVDEVGTLAMDAENPQRISSVCAVLGETDVINMIARQIPIEDVLMGILESIASRVTKLVNSIRAESPVTLTGGLGMNQAMVAAVRKLLKESGSDFEVRAHDDSVYAGAIGAALWGSYRWSKLQT